MATLELDVLVIGFGKAGKTIAMARGQVGDRVAIVERSPQMYGGTCINIACVPTKTLLVDAHRNTAFADAQTRRNGLVDSLNAANQELAENDHVLIIDGTARFTAPRTVQVTGGQEKLEVTASTIIINTGSQPVWPKLPGIDGPRVHDSTSVQQLDQQPSHLVIVGGGPIGLEFATMFHGFGTQVTVLDGAEEFLGNFDRDIAEPVREHLSAADIRIIGEAKASGFQDTSEGVVVSYNEDQKVRADAVLVAIGRRPATDGLGLDNAGIEVDDHGAVVVDEYLKTTAEGVYAAGDVTGGPQFTYVSYDDHRVILGDRWGENTRTTTGRLIPTTTFLQPPLSEVGMREEDAREETTRRGHTLEVKVSDIADIAIMPRPKIVDQPAGRAKFLIDREADQILGAVLWCVDSQELINLVTVAINHDIPASALGAEIYVHPSSTEVFNALLG